MKCVETSRDGSRRGTLAVAAILALLAPAAAAAADPWQALAQVRDRLEAGGAASATFTQTYVPAGFSAGDTESGRLALDLPRCLRWDYDEPYPKSFLICGDQVHYWNPEDGTGRAQRIDAENEPGLDLLLLAVDRLRERYRASATSGDGTAVLVRLEPRSPLQDIAEAELTLDPDAGRVLALEYRDREGNRSRFDLSGYAPLAETTGIFLPPAGILWEQGG